MVRNAVQPMHIWLVALQLIVVAVVAAAFNLLPQWVGLYGLPGYPPVVPLLSAELPRYLPWLNLLLGALFALALVKLWRGRHTRWSVWSSILVDGLALAVAARLLFGPSIIGLNPAYAAFHELTVAESALIATELAPLASTITRGLLCMALFVLLVDAYVRLVRLAHADSADITHVGRVG